MRAVMVRIVLVTVAAAAVSWSLAAQQPASSQVTAQDLLDGLKNPTRWLTYGGDYGNQRHSPLTQITPANVRRLAPQWTVPDRHARASSRPRRSSLDGVRLRHRAAQQRAGRSTRAPAGRSGAIAATLPNGLIACCGLVNRGFGVLGDRLFMTTLDAHLLALEPQDRRDRVGRGDGGLQARLQRRRPRRSSSRTK